MKGIAARFDAANAGAFGRSFGFSGLREVIVAHTLDEVAPALQRVEAAVAGGLHAAGYLAYEAAAGLNRELPAGKAPAAPLLWFALFCERHDGGTASPGRPPAIDDVIPVERDTRPDAAGHAAAIAAIRAAIAAGETYQVNYTVRQGFAFAGDAAALYRRLCASQRAPFCALLATGEETIVSASPELFFARQGERIVMRPMKGTAARQPEAEADRRAAERLRQDPKERAENLMIVDLVRNDLGRIAVTGSVAVESLFDVETYPTVHQLTSTVSARLQPGTTLSEIFRALFPCGSVTGAPKRRTMELIEELEPEPRGVYCGAIGFVSPDETVFSVAIRTVVLDQRGHAELGLGSGVTWDSRPEAEYAECLAKGKFLDAPPQDFRLIEALLCRDGSYPLLARHLTRLAASANYFAFRCDVAALRAALLNFGLPLVGSNKVRLLLARDGSCELGSEPLAKGSATPLRVALATTPVDSQDVLRYHKTERRELFDDERRRAGTGEVLFVNERGELTEGSYHNLVLRIDGQLLTPALTCGLLPGVLRAELLERGILREAILTVVDLQRADGLWLINSVRGWRRGEMVEVAEIEPASV